MLLVSRAIWLRSGVNLDAPRLVLTNLTFDQQAAARQGRRACSEWLAGARSYSITFFVPSASVTVIEALMVNLIGPPGSFGELVLKVG